MTKQTISLPEPDELSLADACSRIAKTTDKSRLSDSVKSALIGALRDGKITAYCDMYDRNGVCRYEHQELLPQDWSWKNVPESDYTVLIYGLRQIPLKHGAAAEKTVYAQNIRIKTVDFNACFFPTPESRVMGTNKAEKDCMAYLEDNATTGERLKSSWFNEYKDKNPCLTRRAFDRAWARVAQKHPVMSKAGRPRKSL